MIGTLTPSLAELDVAWVGRLRATAEFAALVGYEADDGRPEEDRLRLKRGWPAVMLARPTREAVPLVTWERLTTSSVGETPPFVQIVANVWVWAPDLALLNDIDNAMQTAFGGFNIVPWEDPASHLWVSSALVSSLDPTSAKLNRRRTVWEVTPNGA